MKFSHLDRQGKPQMVDISSKPRVSRTAVAELKVEISPETAALIQELKLPKGNPFDAARLAGIQAAKQTGSMIPLCHTLPLDFVDVRIELRPGHFWVQSEVKCRWSTGVEMEALTAAAVAALTLYDMCKAVDRGLRITDLHLVEKKKEDPGTLI